MWHRSALTSPRPAGTPARRPRRQPATRLRVELLDDRCLLSVSPAGDYPVGPNPQAVAAADFNGDGRPDLAVANSGGNSVSVLLGNGNGTFQPAVDFGTGFGPYALAVADFNGDGRLDLASANGEASVSVLLGSGDGTFGAALPAYTSSHPLALAAGHLNGDGRIDLVVTSYYMPNVESAVGYVQVLAGNGDGTFAPPLNTETGSYPESVALADVNADGRQDVITSQNENETYALVLLGNGDGTLQPAAYSRLGESIQVSVAVRDFNADGKPDLVARYGGGVSILAGNGDGTFGAALGGSAGYGAAWRSLAVADFDGDSNADLATTADVILGNGDGSLQPPIRYHGGSGAAVAAADFNGDGRPDLAVVNDTSNHVSVFFNDADWPPQGAPSIVIADASVTEGNTGARAITFTVSLSAAFGQPATVRYATADGTATAGTDYQSTSGTLTIPAGQTTGAITVPVDGDRLGEPDETFLVTLTGATNAIISDGQGVGAIRDDEPRVSIGDVTRAEGKKGQTTLFTFTVTLSAAYDQAVTLSFGTANGTAKAGEDFLAQTGTLTFAPGQTTKTITIAAKGDSKREADETFTVELFGAGGNSLLLDAVGLGTILNDD